MRQYHELQDAQKGRCAVASVAIQAHLAFSDHLPYVTCLSLRVAGVLQPKFLFLAVQAAVKFAIALERVNNTTGLNIVANARPGA